MQNKLNLILIIFAGIFITFATIECGGGEESTEDDSGAGEDRLSELMSQKRLTAISGYDFEFTSNLKNAVQKKPVPPGEYEVGSNDPSNRLAYPRHKVKIDSFRLLGYPIINTQYEHFVKIGAYQDKTLWSDEGWKWKTENKITQPKGWENYNPSDRLQGQQPVTGVSFYEAEAFCNSLAGSPEKVKDSDFCKEVANDAYCKYVKGGGKEYAVRLPNEFEFEVASTNGQAQAYPWGEPQDGIVRTPNTLKSVAGDEHSGDLNTYKLQDLEALVYHWTISPFELYPGNDQNPNEVNPKLGDPNYVVGKGSAFYKNDVAGRSQFRLPLHKGTQDVRVGFRILVREEAWRYVKSVWLDVDTSELDSAK